MTHQDTNTIFDLEQQILECWRIVDDLKDLGNTFHKLEDLQKFMEAEATIGQARFERMWNTFEKICQDYHKFRAQASWVEPKEKD